MKISRGPYSAVITNKDIKFYYLTNLMGFANNISSGVISISTRVAEMLQLRPEDQELLEFITDLSRALNVDESLFFNRIGNVNQRSLANTSELLNSIDRKRQAKPPATPAESYPLEYDLEVSAPSTDTSYQEQFIKMLENYETYRTRITMSPPSTTTVLRDKSNLI